MFMISTGSCLKMQQEVQASRTSHVLHGSKAHLPLQKGAAVLSEPPKSPSAHRAYDNLPSYQVPRDTCNTSLTVN